MKQFKHSEGNGTLAKRDINDNTYIIAHFRDIPQVMVDHRLLVFANPKTGADNGLPDHPDLIFEPEYELIVRRDVGMRDTEPIETYISKSLNKAVCIVEDKQQEEQRYQKAIEAALTANEEVHGGIDAALD